MSRKWALGRRRETDDDTIHIDEESANEWWVERDQLDRTIDRRWRTPAPGGQYPFRREADRRGRSGSGDAETGSSPFFAPQGAPVTGTARTPHADPAPHRKHPPLPPPDAFFAPGPPEEEVEPEPTASSSPWDVLGLTSEATWDEVAQRHRELAKQHHPDRAVDLARDAAATTMASINAAFHDLRRIYRYTAEL